MVVRAHDLKVNTFCKTAENIKHSGCQFSTLEEAGEVFGNTHGKRNPVVVSVTNKIQVCCDTEYCISTYLLNTCSDGINLSSYLRLHISAGTP